MIILATIIAWVLIVLYYLCVAVLTAFFLTFCLDMFIRLIEKNKED